MNYKKYISLTFCLLISIVLNSQCELDQICIHVQDTLVLKSEVKHVDLHAFVKTESKFLSSESITDVLKSKGIEFEELYDNEYSAFGNSKKFRIQKPSNNVLSEIDELHSSRGNMLVKYELNKTETEAEIFKRELSKVKSASKLKAQLISNEYNCKIESTNSIELVNSNSKYEDVIENKLDALIGWNSSINFNKNDKLIKEFEYIIKFSLK